MVLCSDFRPPRADRPGLDECLAYVRDGDELYVASIGPIKKSLRGLNLNMEGLILEAQVEVDSK